MKLKNILLLILSLYTFRAMSQEQAPQFLALGGYNDPICSNTQNKIPVQVYGTFNPDNRIQVELISYLNRESLGKYDATYENGHLLFTIDKDLKYTYTDIYFQINTTSPVTKSYQIERRWYTRGNVVMSLPLGQSDTLNTGTTLPINFLVDANNPVTITFSDSSTRQISGSSNVQTIGLLAKKSQDIFIVKAVNSCGVSVPASGTLQLTVNPTFIVPGKLKTQEAICEGSDIELTYFVTGGTIPPSASFKLRLFKQDSWDSKDQRIFEIPAQKKADGLLTARIPKDFVSTVKGFKIAILVAQPGLVSSYSEPISIYPKPSAKFKSQSETVEIGKTFTIGLDLVGPAPFTVKLSNGVSYPIESYEDVKVVPTKTESLSILSLSSGCGVTTDLPKENILLTVPTGIAISAPANQKFAICENQIVKVPFVTNATLNPNTKFVVEGITRHNTTYSFDAKRVGDSLEFMIPLSPAEWIEKSYSDIGGFRIKTSNPSMISEYRYNFNIQGVPKVVYENLPQGNIPAPQYIYAGYRIYGGTPVYMEDNNGFTSSIDFGFRLQPIFVDKTGNYALKSIKNECFNNTNPTALNFTVGPKTSQTPSIVVHPPANNYICNTDSVEINFESFGQFGADNEYKIYSSNYGVGTLLIVKKPGRYKIPFNKFELPSSNYIRVESSSPVITGTSEIPFNIETKPQIVNTALYEKATVNKPLGFEMGSAPVIYFQHKNMARYSAKFSDGTKDFDFQQTDNNHSFNPSLERSVITPYTIKSISNVCGTTPLNISTHLVWYGYKLSMGNFQEYTKYCVGEEIVVPIQLDRGTIPAGTVYNLQIAKDESEYRTVASNSTGENFKYMVPDTMTGRYRVRIFTTTGSVMTGKAFFVNKKPTASVSLMSPSQTEIEYGTMADVVYTVTGGQPWEIILEDRGNFTGDSDVMYTSSYLTKGTTFNIKSVSNQCGFGSVIGSVSVAVKPKILEYKIENQNVCKGEAVLVNYKIGGDIPAGEKVGFFLTTRNGTRYDLPVVEKAVGNVSITIPTNLENGNYDLTFYISGTDVKKVDYITIQQPADMELMGNTTINPGESTSIPIRSTSQGNIPTTVILSDGTNIKFDPWFGSSVYNINVNVKPKTTTTYTIVSATSRCGNPKFVGSAVVTVNPSVEKTVRVVGLNKWNPLCENDTILVSYSQTGTFSSGNQFTAQFFDSQGKLVQSVPTTATKSSTVQVVLPKGLSTTDLYRIRLAASDPNTGSSDYQGTLSFGSKASAYFGNTFAIPDKDGVAKAVVHLSGTGPWQYSYGNELGSLYKSATSAPDTLLITSKGPNAYFKLLSVSNTCGNGSITEPSLIKVEIILGNEAPQSSTDPIIFGPNPTRGEVSVRFNQVLPRHFQLYQLNGSLIWQEHSMKDIQNINMESYPSGIYLLKIQHPKGSHTLKIVKE